jgi:asparagine synthase (glutamine-hydrolysing)
MCGIAGIISSDTSLVSMPRLELMAGKLVHRGPDGSGFWLSRDKTAGFAHRRLSIIDLGVSDDQPMRYLVTVTIMR